jgi:hypothetical protein
LPARFEDILNFLTEIPDIAYYPDLLDYWALEPVIIDLRIIMGHSLFIGEIIHARGHVKNMGWAMKTLISMCYPRREEIHTNLLVISC